MGGRGGSFSNKKSGESGFNSAGGSGKGAIKNHLFFNSNARFASDEIVLSKFRVRHAFSDIE